MTPVSGSANEAVQGVLRDVAGTFTGDLRADQLSRGIYATDASIYEIVPDAVAMPRTADDVAVLVCACAARRVPLTARGAGTGLAGGAINRGIILDLSRHMHRVLEIDPVRRIARVEPGVVLDDLNARLAAHGLQFAPDVATSSRATIGGMIANNSCGAHSVMYGRTVDHVLGLDVVLADGSIVEWGNSEFGIANGESLNPESAKQAEQILKQVAGEYADEIAARFPKVMRRNGGYALDRLKIDDAGRVNTETLICGSEGTLGVVTGASLKLVPVAPHKGIVVAHFHALLDALAATPAALEHTPAAVELLDHLILDAARQNPIMSRRPWLIEGRPRGVLIIELYDDDGNALLRRLNRVAEDLRSRGLGYAWPILTSAADQDNLWFIRKSGLGLLMSTPGDRQTYDFVEDTAVDPSRLRDYIARFMQVLAEEGVPEASYYAHASVGCLHVKPILNLKDAGDIQKMYRIADRISSLALEFGGTMTGEHGDGILRSCWLEKMYGPRIIEAFRQIKTAFDPNNILNPGKIVDPYPMIGQFRYGEAYRSADVETTLDFSAFGGMAGMAEMCSGVGQCRQKLVGTMCPSYMATLDEQHTTRARANALRLALSNRDAISGLDDPALDAAMDLCISCKACKSECPTGVDMAKLKAEWQWRKIQKSGAPLRSRMIAGTPFLARLCSRVPALANFLARSSLVGHLGERVFGISRQIPVPHFAKTSLATRLARMGRREHGGFVIPGRQTSGDNVRQCADEGRPAVVYFADTWSRYFTPAVGEAAVRALVAMGFRVLVPRVGCCGRPAISKGLLGHAQSLARRNIDVLAGYAADGIPILTTEPSCYSAMVDEWPQLVRTDAARLVAGTARPFESFMLEALQGDAARRIGIKPATNNILLHGHCHQKAVYGTADTLALLRIATSGDVREINSGCCGMAGSFGHEAEHVAVSKAMGEQRLFPAVRERGNADIAVTGFSCRHQIECHAGGAPRHVAEFVAACLVRD